MTEFANAEDHADTLALSGPLRNRLTIGHLFLWTTTTAASIAILRPYTVEGGHDPSDVEAVWYYRTQQLMLVGIAPIVGAGLAAMVLAVRAWFRRSPPFPTQPGHWLLFAIGIKTATVLSLLCIARIVHSPSQLAEIFEFVFPMAIVFSFVATGVMLFSVASREHFVPRWRAGLRIVGACLVAFPIFQCCMPIYLGGWLGLSTLCVWFGAPSVVVAISVFDFAKGARHDVLHWLGVMSFPALAAALSTAVLLGF